MSEIVNLRRERKRRKRQRAENTAAESRAKFGRTLNERALALKVEVHQDRILDGAKIEK